MTDDEDAITELMDRANEMDDGPAKVDVLAEAAALADTRNDVEAGFAVRKALLEAALAGGQPEPMTVAFSWCLAMSDRHPQIVPPEQMLWEYRWVLSEMPHFPQIPLQQILDAIADMTRRYRAAGSTLRPVHLLRLNVSISLGDPAMADAAYRDWQGTERDHLSDSARTEQGFVVDYLIFRKHYDEAIAMSPNVMNGRVDDTHFFGQDSAELLVPLLELGRVADAVRVQRSGYRYIANKHRYLNSISSHMDFHARMDNWAGGTKVFEDHIGFALATKQYSDRFEFLRGCYLFFLRLARSGATRAKLRVPKEMPVQPGPDRKVAVADVVAWLKADLDEWAAKFDARNGNAHHTNELAAADAAAQLPAPKV